MYSGSEIGGVSAVNPQAKGNYQQYIDASYNNAKGRLDPIFSDQTSAYDQSLVNRGLPIGGDAANKSMQQLQQNQNDAYSNAAFDAMGFGLGAQAQDFGQDATRSGLANALLQSKWGNETSKYGIDINKDLGYAQLDEQGREWDQGLGYKYDTLGQQGYEFDRGLDKSYYDTDSRYDYMYDRAGQDDYRFGVNQDRQDYYDQRQAGAYDDAFMMQLLGMGGTPSPYFQDPTAAYNAQVGSQTNQYLANMGMLGDVAQGSGAAIASDARLKTNISKVGEIDGNNIYTWDWNTTAQALGIDSQTFGVIAQEINPAYVRLMANGYLGVDYGGLFG